LPRFSIEGIATHWSFGGNSDATENAATSLISRVVEAAASLRMINISARWMPEAGSLREIGILVAGTEY
jgi:hypothetical protein